METVLLANGAPIAGVRASELDDFDSLVNTYRTRVFRYLLASLRDRDAAENLTQDCFVRAYQARAKFRGDSSVSTWLMSIAVNLMRDHVTSSRLRFWKRAQQAGVEASEASEWLPDRHASPETAALARQQVETVWKTAAGLSERQRTVFLLRFVEDMDLLEIAAVTGLKEGTVKTHLFRAVQSLRLGLEHRI